MVDLASDAAIAIDGRGCVIAWNNKAEALLGYTQSEVIGRSCREVLQAVLPGGEPLCTPNCEILRCFRKCSPRGIDNCRMRRKDGDWVNVRYSSLVNANGTRLTRPNAAVAVVFLHSNRERCGDAPQDLTLHVYTLGKFSLTIGGISVPVEKWVRKQSVTLLKYLVSQLGRPIHRERILESLWPDVDASRGWDRLKVTISYLRGQLRSVGAGEDALITVGKAYQLRRDAVRLDVDIFEQFIADGRALQTKGRIDEALRCYRQADHLYRGDYLEEETFADWCAEERERLRELYLEMLSDMVDCLADGEEYPQASHLCRKALVHEPCRESFHHKLMVYLDRLGRTDEAVAQYRICRALLQRELGVEPMPETRQSYETMLKRQRRLRGRVPNISHLGWSGSLNS